MTVEPETERLPVNPDAILFSADIQAATKATDIAFENGDEISVFATTAKVPEETNYAQNVKYTYYDALFSTSEELVYPDEYTTLSFYAVYPYGSYTTPSFDFAVNKDQSTNETYTGSDLMTASQVAKNEDVVDLRFSHRMAKVVINLNARNLPAGESAATSAPPSNASLASKRSLNIREAAPEAGTNFTIEPLNPLQASNAAFLSSSFRTRIPLCGVAAEITFR